MPPPREGWAAIGYTPGMRLRFIVDPRYVVAHGLSANRDLEKLPGWLAVMNEFYNRDMQAYDLLAGEAEVLLPHGKRDANLVVIARRADAMLKSMTRTAPGQRMIRDTRVYAKRVEAEWRRNGAWALAQIAELTRIPLPAGDVRVFITHPKLRNGRAISRDTIVWGASPKFRNYTTVYLAHELLHILNWGVVDRANLSHAAIELLADNELRIRLNGEGKYFEYPGHTELRDLERKLLPAWREYLRTPTMTFHDFIRANRKTIAKKESRQSDRS